MVRRLEMEPAELRDKAGDNMAAEREILEYGRPRAWVADYSVANGVITQPFHEVATAFFDEELPAGCAVAGLAHAEIARALLRAADSYTDQDGDTAAAVSVNR